MTPRAQGLRVIPVNEDRLLLKRGIREILVSGHESHTVVHTLLALLDGTRNEAEAIAALPDDQQEAGLELLEALRARDLLGDDDARPGAPDELQSSFYANFGATGFGAFEALQRSHVVVDGAGLVAQSLRAALSSLGVERVTTGQDESDATAADVVVGASDVGDEALLAPARRALTAGVRFLPAWISELIGFVGPLTIPFETACLRCYQLRVDSNVRDIAAHRAVRSHAAAAPEASSTGFLPPMAAVVGQVAAVEIAKAIGGFAPSDTVGRSIELNLVSFRSEVRRVLKVPRCPECGQSSRHGPRVALTGPQITE
jgi:bacteriocin biosynthesis cyclodehydratase domain-containing protein